MEKITFSPDEGRPEDFYVLEQTVIDGRSYILVTDEEEGDSTALILRDDSEAGDTDALYTIVEDEDELERCAKVFSSLLDDDGVTLDLD